MNELIKPFFQIFTNPPLQWHPILVHLPIMFLILEALFVWMYLFTKKSVYNQYALTALKVSFWSIWFIAIAGLHDNGLSQEGGNHLQFILKGFHARMENLWRFQSTLTIHFWLAETLIVLTLIRFIWRLTAAKDLKGLSGFLYGLIALVGLWLLFTVSYVGGNISHM